MRSSIVSRRGCRRTRGRASRGREPPEPASGPRFVDALHHCLRCRSHRRSSSRACPRQLVLGDADVLDVARSSWNAVALTCRSSRRAVGRQARLPTAAEVRPGIRPSRRASASTMLPTSGTPLAVKENHSPCFEVAPRNCILRSAPSERDARLPSKVDEASLACADSASCRSAWARWPSAVLQPARSRAAPTSVARSRVTQPHRQGLRELRIPTWYVRSVDEELTQTVRAAMPYAETLGLELLAASPDEVRGRIAWEERLTTAGGLAPRRRPDGARGHRRRRTAPS